MTTTIETLLERIAVALERQTDAFIESDKRNAHRMEEIRQREALAGAVNTKRLEEIRDLDRSAKERDEKLISLLQSLPWMKQE